MTFFTRMRKQGRDEKGQFASGDGGRGEARDKALHQQGAVDTHKMTAGGQKQIARFMAEIDGKGVGADTVAAAVNAIIAADKQGHFGK